MIIGIMVAALLAGIGWFLYRRSSGGSSGGSTPAVSGASPVTDQARAETQQRVREATDKAYAENDTAALKRAADAVNEAANLASLAASKGMSVDQLYQSHLQQQFIESRPAFNAINRWGPVAPKDLYNVVASGGPAGPPAGVSAPPGQYWDYGQQKYVALIF